MRSCGGTEHLSGTTLYHSGQTATCWRDPPARTARRPCSWLGFSLGGNVVLKLAGELGDWRGELVAGVAAVSTPIDLAACVQHAPAPFQHHLLPPIPQAPQGAHPREGTAHAGPVPTWPISIACEASTSSTTCSPRASFGFGTADNYYATQSSNQFLEHIRVPALLVQAKDDPLIPFEIYRHPAFEQNPACGCSRSTTAATWASSPKPSRASGWTRFSYTG